MSLHARTRSVEAKETRYDLKDLPALLETHDTMGVLTDKENNPAVIAALLASSPPVPRVACRLCRRENGLP